MFVCPLAVALALVGAGGRLSFCLCLFVCHFILSFLPPFWAVFLCSFSLLLEIIRIRLIRICARFGAGSGSHFWVVPPFRLRISFDVLLLASKCGCRCSHSIDARPLCQTSGCSVYSTYNYLRYLSIKIQARAKRQKSLVYQRFSAFSHSVFRPFSMYKHCPHNVQVLPPMMYKDCPLNVQTLPPYN